MATKYVLIKYKIAEKRKRKKKHIFYLFSNVSNSYYNINYFIINHL